MNSEDFDQEVYAESKEIRPAVLNKFTHNIN